jgi:hypothetical protein
LVGRLEGRNKRVKIQVPKEVFIRVPPNSKISSKEFGKNADPAKEEKTYRYGCKTDYDRFNKRIDVTTEEPYIDERSENNLSEPMCYLHYGDLRISDDIMKEYIWISILSYSDKQNKYYRAWDLDNNNLKILNNESQKLGRRQYQNLVNIELKKEYLLSHRKTGLDLKMYGVGYNTTLNVPPEYVKQFIDCCIINGILIEHMSDERL